MTAENKLSMWVCNWNVTDSKNYFRPDYSRPNLRYDPPRKCPTILYGVNLSEATCSPANTRRRANAGLMLCQGRRRWPSISPALVQCLVFAVSCDIILFQSVLFSYWAAFVYRVIDLYMGLQANPSFIERRSQARTPLLHSSFKKKCFFPVHS